MKEIPVIAFTLTLLVLLSVCFAQSPTPIPSNFVCDLPIIEIDCQGQYIGEVDIKANGKSFILI